MDKKFLPRRDPPTPAAPATAPKPGAPHPATESGWLPDCVYTGDKFEVGLAFFSDALGRITRFSREPADLAAARRLAGQAALPGLVNAHSHAFHRVLRGRTERLVRADRDPGNGWREAHDRVVGIISAEDVFDAARMVFMEMLLSGITCVGEFHYLQQRADGTAWPERNFLAQEVMRAAHEVGIRIGLLQVAYARADYRSEVGSVPGPFFTGSVDQSLRDAEALRTMAAKNYAADEVWTGVAPYSLGAVPLDQIKALAAYARSHRLRWHLHVATRAEEAAACTAEYGRTPIALLAEHGLVDKRFTAVDAIHLTDDDVRLLGAARAIACACPITGHNLGLGVAPFEKLLAAGAGVALGTDSAVQVDLLKDARLLEYERRLARRPRSGLTTDPATALFHAATVAGARSLGATGGALEIGRPADFFTVSLHDPSIAGADAETLLASIVFALERRAIRDVWIGARQRLSNGRHALHGPIVGRFVDGQRRLWASA